MSISSNRLYSGLGILIVILLASGVLSYRHTRQLRDDAVWVVHTQEVLAALEQNEVVIGVRDNGMGIAPESPAPPILPVPVRNSGPVARSRRVLIIDDDPGVRSTSAMLLRSEGYQVAVAADGEQGIRQALDLRPELAIIDLGMPGLDGCQVAARIRADLGQDIRLVALTGFSRETDRERTRAAGFDRHLVKSGDPRELLEMLQEL